MNDKPQALKLTDYHQTLVRNAVDAAARIAKQCGGPYFLRQADELERLLKLFRNSDIAVVNAFDASVPTIESDELGAQANFDPFDATRNEQLLREEGI